MNRIKTQVAFRKDLLQRIDQLVQRRKRSLFIEEAVEEKLKRMQLQKSFARVAGLWKDRGDMVADSGRVTYLKKSKTSDDRRAARLGKAWNYGKTSS